MESFYFIISFTDMQKFYVIVIILATRIHHVVSLESRGHPFYHQVSLFKSVISEPYQDQLRVHSTRVQN